MGDAAGDLEGDQPIPSQPGRTDDGPETIQEGRDPSERSFIKRIAASWQLLAGLFGYRLRPEPGATFETVASLASADLRGHVIMALATPEFATQRIRARPFGARQEADWSPPALALASIAMAFLEPDPAIAWDDERITSLRQALEREDLLPK